MTADETPQEFVRRVFMPFFDKWAPEVYRDQQAANDFAECIAAYDTYLTSKRRERLIERLAKR